MTSKTTFFMSKADAEKVTDAFDSGGFPDLADKAILVSIVSPETSPHDATFLGFASNYKWEPPKVDSARWVDVLKLQFNDIDPSHCSESWLEQWTLFDDAVADQVIDFFERNKDKASVIVAHCEAGISRSAAVSKFAAVYFNATFPESYMLYNKHVFSTLLRRWRQRALQDIKDSHD